MEYIKINGLENEISKVILGTAWMTLDNKEEADRVLCEYIKSGGNVVDTGRFYVGGKTEEYLRQWIKENKELREKVMFISKACHHFVDENNVHYPDEERVSAENITIDLEYSLKNMDIERFEIFMLHRDDLTKEVGPLMDRLEKHRLEGKIGAYGVSNWSIERIKEAQEYCKGKVYQGITVNSPSYSLATVEHPRWERTVYATDEYARWNTENNITLLSWGAQGGGFFGKVPFPKGVKITEDFVKAYYTTTNLEKKRRVEEIAELKGENVECINVALSYILSQDLKVAAIIGPRNVKQVQSTMNVFDIKLTKEEIEYLALEKDEI